MVDPYPSLQISCLFDIVQSQITVSDLSFSFENTIACIIFNKIKGLEQGHPSSWLGTAMAHNLWLATRVRNYFASKCIISFWGFNYNIHSWCMILKLKLMKLNSILLARGFIMQMTHKVWVRELYICVYWIFNEGVHF